MPVMVRKQVYLEPRQNRRLKQVAKKAGVTEAEIIRRALEERLRDLESADNRLKAWQESKAFIDQWIAKGPVPAGRRWTRDELHDRSL